MASDKITPTRLAMLHRYSQFSPEIPQDYIQSFDLSIVFPIKHDKASPLTADWLLNFVNDRGIILLSEECWQSG